MNEEMETRHEEIQASNEELRSINEELKQRNTQLSKAYNGVLDLVQSLDIPSLVVDNNLRICQFTPPAQKVLNLIPKDMGRPIGDINTNIQVSDLSRRMRQVINTLVPLEEEVQDSNEHWYLMRIRPYRIDKSTIGGAVLCLIDIDSLKRPVPVNS